jgi:CYTH domain-containing protein
MSAEGTEIERKFLVAGVPTEMDAGERVDQGYLALGENGLEVRLRRKGDRRLLTIKQGSGRTRVEEELPVDPEVFDRLWPLTEGRRVEKDRHLVPLAQDLTAEVDVYRGDLEGLEVVEVEFSSEEAADAFDPPDWIGREVTDDGRYANRALASEGLPPGSNEKK